MWVHYSESGTYIINKKTLHIWLFNAEYTVLLLKVDKIYWKWFLLLFARRYEIRVLMDKKIKYMESNV